MNPVHPVYASMATTVFERMSGMARELGAINLGQGFPDAPGPPEVIEAAEESGLIVSIGNWVLRQACAQNKDWQDLGLPNIRVAVNVSTRQFRGEKLVDEVTQALRAQAAFAIGLDEVGHGRVHQQRHMAEHVVEDVGLFQVVQPVLAPGDVLGTDRVLHRGSGHYHAARPRR